MELPAVSLKVGAPAAPGARERGQGSGRAAGGCQGGLSCGRSDHPSRYPSSPLACSPGLSLVQILAEALLRAAEPSEEEKLKFLLFFNHVGKGCRSSEHHGAESGKV